MNYGEHFKSRVLVEATTEDYSLIVEGKIAREDENYLYLEDAYILKSRKIYQSPEVMINKEFIESVDSAKQGEIFEIAESEFKSFGMSDFYLCNGLFLFGLAAYLLLT